MRRKKDITITEDSSDELSTKNLRERNRIMVLKTALLEIQEELSEIRNE